MKGISFWLASSWLYLRLGRSFGERYPKLAGWAYLFSIPLWVWQLWAGWPGNPTDEELKRQYSPAIPALLLWIPCFWLLYWQRAHSWAVVGVALLSAVVAALATKYIYKLSAIAAFAGWSLTIPVVFSLHWPTSQRFWLVLVLGGLTTTLHGVLRFAKALLSVRQHAHSESHA
jgi:hypothetical protein